MKKFILVLTFLLTGCYINEGVSGYIVKEFDRDTGADVIAVIGVRCNNGAEFRETYGETYQRL